MPKRLVNKPLSRHMILERDFIQWTNCVTADAYFIPRRMGNDLSKCLTTLAALINVPQRCISAICPGSFYIHCFQGRTPPGNYPVNTYVCDDHCHICDDFLVQESRHCIACGVFSCPRCFTETSCWLCVSEEKGYQPQSRREVLLDEVYSRNPWNHDFPQDSTGQLTHLGALNFFPFAPARFVMHENVSELSAEQVTINTIAIATDTNAIQTSESEAIVISISISIDFNFDSIPFGLPCRYDNDVTSI